MRLPQRADLSGGQGIAYHTLVRDHIGRTYPAPKRRKLTKELSRTHSTHPDFRPLIPTDPDTYGATRHDQHAVAVVSTHDDLVPFGELNRLDDRLDCGKFGPVQTGKERNSGK